MRSNRSLAVPALAALVLVAGCRQDMHNQPKYRPLRPSTLFADGSSARQPVEGTVARGTLHTDEALFTGKVNGSPVTEMPFAITARTSTAARSASTSSARLATIRPAAAPAWWSSGATASRRRSISSG